MLVGLRLNVMYSYVDVFLLSDSVFCVLLS